MAGPFWVCNDINQHVSVRSEDGTFDYSNLPRPGAKEYHDDAKIKGRPIVVGATDGSSLTHSMT